MTYPLFQHIFQQFFHPPTKTQNSWNRYKIVYKLRGNTSTLPPPAPHIKQWDPDIFFYQTLQRKEKHWPLDYSPWGQCIGKHTTTGNAAVAATTAEMEATSTIWSNKIFVQKVKNIGNNAGYLPTLPLSREHTHKPHISYMVPSASLSLSPDAMSSWRA